MRFFLLTILTQLALSGAIGVAAETPGFGLAEPFPSDEYEIEVIAQGLDTPWDITWLPNGDTLITERDGALRLMRGGELMAAPIDGLPSVYASSQAGLFEVAPHPRFEDNGWIYFSYAH
ncbi:MAG: PQQ-dependent sugar dehydrogenase, partial [Pseudomonadota bacterium]